MQQFSESLAKNFISAVESFDVQGYLDSSAEKKENLTLIHGDTNLNNVLFDSKNGSLVLIDYQKSCYSNATKDIVLFIGLSLHPHLIPQNLKVLKDFYFDNLKKNAPLGSSLDLSYSRESFELDWIDSVKFGFLSYAVGLSLHSSQKPNENDNPKSVKRYQLSCIIQKRFIALVQSEGIENVFGK